MKSFLCMRLNLFTEMKGKVRKRDLIPIWIRSLWRAALDVRSKSDAHLQRFTMLSFSCYVCFLFAVPSVDSVGYHAGENYSCQQEQCQQKDRALITSLDSRTAGGCCLLSSGVVGAAGVMVSAIIRCLSRCCRIAGIGRIAWC